MDVLRTPDERFEGLTDWPFAPRYTQITDPDGTRLRLHHVDEGPGDQRPILLMHGEPSWAYLYRKIIADLVARGRRAVAPDLVGFGRSDKPASRGDYTYERHVAWMSDWLVRNDLKDIVLFCQDWGGLIGLRLVAAFPERFAAVVVSNTGMPVGQGKTEGFEAWLNFSQNVPELPIGFILNGGTSRDLSDAERAAYDAPFPDESYKEGARQFPALVPITPEHASIAENEAAWKVLERFDKPFLTAFSDADPITRGGEAIFQARVPATQKSKHVTLKGGHFIQEDAPAEIAALLDELVASLPQPEAVA
ncbi:haloalkane dehalogenase [Caulobacter segnis]|uniref:Haloalkane dehalogenase n=2 Tax=Caulobacter segnis TaxID=88688 RepID=D5VKY2_CAUST|nr:haloalkane dehalogenase [Caulobacter segnis]ADG11155.1 alpha/beta hydrolase fold protein [Caulobacter segnis ATCC 21756]AVQ02840.1 haloalkane dehalogenase [Caulobacter segnis]